MHFFSTIQMFHDDTPKVGSHCCQFELHNYNVLGIEYLCQVFCECLRFMLELQPSHTQLPSHTKLPSHSKFRDIDFV